MLTISTLYTITIHHVYGHGAVVYPPPRNNIDFDKAPWSQEVPYPVPAVSNPDSGYWCPIPDGKGSLSGKNGQACFWFSNGCSIGCPECDGKTRGPSIHTDKMDMMYCTN